jgi:uncharacterized protein (TIGR01244 family)
MVKAAHSFMDAHMAIQLQRLAEDFHTAPQLGPADMAELARAGIRSVINNRPDGEGGPEQPTDAAIAEAARAAGLDYVYQPVRTNAITEQDVARFAELVDTLPKPIVAFCRSGNRSGKLYVAARSMTARSSGQD